MVTIKIDWNILNESFKRNRKSLEVFCVPVLLYNLFGGSLKDISIFGLSSNGSILTRPWLIVPTIIIILIYLTYRYWQSFKEVKKELDNVNTKLFERFAQDIAENELSKKQSENRGSRYEVVKPDFVKLLRHDRALLAEYRLSDQEISRINFKIKKFLTTEQEGIALEIYMPLYIAGATAFMMLFNFLLSLNN